MVLLSRERFQSVVIDYHHIERIDPHIVEEAAVAPFGQNIQARYASSGTSGSEGKSTARLFW